MFDVLQLLRRPESRPAPVRTPGRREAPGSERGRLLACGFCGRPITRPAARTERGGHHQHRFTNPHGITFGVGCFSEAHGCTHAGAPTSFWTWFPGYRWQLALCGSCREHLGWRFASAADSFHALIVDRLTEVDEA